MKLFSGQHFIKTSTGKIIALIILCVFPMNVFMILNSHYQLRTSLHHVTLSLQNTANTYINTIDDYAQNIDTTIYELVTNDASFVRLRITEDDFVYLNTRVQCFWRMHNLISLHSVGSALFVYRSDRDDILLSVNSAYESERAALASYIKEECTSSDNLQWRIIELNGQKWILHVFRNKNFYYGALINLDTFIAEIRSVIPYESARISFSCGGQPSGDDGLLHVPVQSSYTPLPLLLDIQLDRRELNYTFIYSQLFNIVLVILFLGIIPILILYIRKLFTSSIHELSYAHRQLQIGNTSYRIGKKISSQDLQSVFDSFNRMADNVDTLEAANLQKDLEQKQMMLDNLQLQIRPHFLHNIFNLIYLLCEDKNLEGVQNIIIYLSEYFRVIYQPNQAMIPFDQELELIHGYIYATAIRYPDMIQINYQIEPEISFIRVPPLLIHNFIENIVKHALIPNKKIHITLSALYEEDTVVFQISDNGRGMSPEAVEIINQYGTGSYKGTPYDGHVGLRNSVQRLKYFYGEQASISVESELGQGTVFVIVIPNNAKETEDSL